MEPITREQFFDITRSLKLRLRRELRFVPEEVRDWESRDFLAATNRARSEGALIVPFLDKVVPFKLNVRKPNAAGKIQPVVCDICATWQRGSDSAIITLEHQKSSVSFLCCADLLCSLHVRDETAAAKRSRTQLRESISVEQRVERLQMKLARILDTA